MNAEKMRMKCLELAVVCGGGHSIDEKYVLGAARAFATFVETGKASKSPDWYEKKYNLAETGTN
jgi:hypothetical protein